MLELLLPLLTLVSVILKCRHIVEYDRSVVLNITDYSAILDVRVLASNYFHILNDFILRL